MWVVLERLGTWRLRTWGLIALAVVVLLFCYHLRAIFNPLLVGLLLAYILNPAVQWLESRGLGRVGGIVVVYLVLVAAVAGILAFAIPVLYTQAYQGYYAVAGEPVINDQNGNGRYDTHFTDLNDNRRWDKAEPFQDLNNNGLRDPDEPLKDLNANGRRDEDEPFEDVNKNGRWDKGEPFEDLNQNHRWDDAEPFEDLNGNGMFDELPDQYLDINADGRYDRGYLWHILVRFCPDQRTVDEWLNQLRGQAGVVARAGINGLQWVFRQAMAGVSGVLQLVGWLLLVPVYAFFLLLKLPEWRAKVVKYLPGAYRDRIVHVSSRIHHTTSDFFRGRLLLCVVYGIMNAIGFSLCGIPFALIFGVLIGAASLIPVVGTIAIGLPVMAIGYFGADGGMTRTLYVLLVLVVTQAIDGWVLTPYVLGRSAGLNPVVVVLSIFIGGELMGLFGMLIAVPAASAIKILFLELVEPSLLAIAAEPAPAGVTGEPPPPGPVSEGDRADG